MGNTVDALGDDRLDQREALQALLLEAEWSSANKKLIKGIRSAFTPVGGLKELDLAKVQPTARSASLTVGPEFNVPPDTYEGTVHVQRDAAVEFSILAHVGDFDGNRLEVTDFSQPENGNLELLDDGVTFRFIPDVGFSGPVNFDYAISEKGNDFTATVGPLTDEQRLQYQHTGVLSTAEGSLTLNVLPPDSDGAKLNNSALELAPGETITFTKADLLGAEAVGVAPWDPLAVKFITPTGVTINDDGQGTFTLAADADAMGTQNVRVVWNYSDPDPHVDFAFATSTILRVHVAPTELLHVDPQNDRYDGKPTIGPNTDIALSTHNFTLIGADGSSDVVSVPFDATQTGYVDIDIQMLADDWAAALDLSQYQSDQLTIGDPVIAMTGNRTGTISVEIYAESGVADETILALVGTETVTFNREGVSSDGYMTNAPADDLSALNVLENDVGQGLRITAINGQAIPDDGSFVALDDSKGRVALNADGTLNYRPDAETSGSVTFGYTVTDGVSVASSTVTIDDVSPVPVPPVLVSDSFVFDPNTGNANVTFNVFDNDLISETSEIAYFSPQITEGNGLATLSYTEAGQLTVTPNIGAIPPEGAEVRISYVIEDQFGASSVSYATVQLKPVIVAGPPSTIVAPNDDPANHCSVNINTLFAGSGDAYLLYRATASADWIQIASQVGGVRTQTSFVIPNDADLASGEYAMFTNAGGGSNGQNALVGTANAATGTTYVSTVATAANGNVQVAFRQDNGDDAARPEVVITMSKCPEPGAEPIDTDPAGNDRMMPVHDYTFTYTFDYVEESYTEIGGNGSIDRVNRSHTFAVTIPSGALAVGLTFDQLVTMADADAPGIFNVWAAEEADRNTGTSGSATIITTIEDVTPHAHDSFTANTDYDGQDVQLVGFGNTVTAATSGSAPAASAFFIQGDNAITSGSPGDTLGRIWLEVYPDAQSAEVNKTDQDVDIRLTNAFALDGQGHMTDLGAKFFVRPIEGTDQHYEIGLEAEQSITASDFDGQTIVLRLEATDKSTGAVYETAIYFNPTTGTQAGQQADSLKMVSIFNQDITASATGTGTADSFWSSAQQGVVDQIDSALNGWTLYDTSFFAYDGGNVRNENVLRDGNLTIQNASPTVEVNFGGFGVTHLEAESRFRAGLPIMTIGDATVTTRYEYYHPDMNRSSDRIRGTVSKTTSVIGASLDPSMSAADQQFFNDHFRIENVGGQIRIVQTAYFDPATKGPMTIKLQMELRDGGGSASVDYTINANAIVFPGKEIAETLQIPALTPATSASTGVLEPALTDESGVANVVIQGVTITPDVLSQMTAELAGVLPALLADANALAALGLTEDEIRMVQDAATLYDMAAAAPGYVAFDQTEVLSPYALLQQYSAAHGSQAQLDGQMTAGRDKVISDIFGPGVTAANVVNDMLEAISGLGYVDGAFTGEATTNTSLHANLLPISAAQRSEFTKAWMGVATLIDADTTEAFMTQVENEPELVALAYQETFGALIEAANAQGEVITDKFLVYFGGGETPDTLTDAEIEQILADPELVDEFLLAVRGMMQAAGIEGPLMDSLNAGTGAAGFALDWLEINDNQRYYGAGKYQTTSQAATRGMLQVFAQSGSFVEFFNELSVETGITAFASVAAVAEDYFDVRAYSDEVKKDYGNNRGDPRVFGINAFFLMGRLSAMSATAALTDENVTSTERFSLALDAVTAFGDTKHLLVRLAGYATTGNAAEQIAAGNRYYMLADTSGGEVKLSAAAQDVRPEDIVSYRQQDLDDYRQDRQRLRDLRVADPDGNPDNIRYIVFNESGHMVYNEDGTMMTLTTDERKALANRVANSGIAVDDAGSQYLYNKRVAETGLAGWGQDIFALARGVTTEFTMTDEIAVAVLGGERNKLVTLDIADPTAENPNRTKKVKIPVTDDLFNKAVAQLYADEIVGAVDGSVIQIGVDDVDVPVTSALRKAAEDVLDGTVTVTHAHQGAGSNQARLFREFFGLDDFATGIGHLQAAFGPRISDDAIRGWQGLSNRFANSAAGVTHITRSLANSLGTMAEFVGLGLDVYFTVQTFRNDASHLEKGLSVSNLLLGTVGTMAGLAALFGPATVVALANPLGIAVAGLTLVLALATPGLMKLVPPTIPKNGELYQDTAAFLTGGNAFGVNALQGPQVKSSASFGDVALVNGELHIPLDATDYEIADALGDAYDRDDLGFLAPLFGLTYQYADRMA